MRGEVLVPSGRGTHACAPARVHECARARVVGALHMCPHIYARLCVHTSVHVRTRVGVHMPMCASRVMCTHVGCMCLCARM